MVVLRIAKQEKHDAHDDVADKEADDGGSEHRDDDRFDDSPPIDGGAAHQACADHAANQRVRRGRGKPEPPGDQVPDAGTKECRKDDDQTLLLHFYLSRFSIWRDRNDPLADGLCNRSSHHGAKNIHACGHQEGRTRSPCLSGNRGRNRVRSVMEAVGVAEEQCNGNDDAYQDQVKIHGSGFLQCKGFDDIGQIFESVRT